MKISIIGGTGFVGSYLIKALLAAGHTPRVLVRSGSEKKLCNPDQCETVSGDIADQAALQTLIEGSDAVIYLPGILRELPKQGVTFEAVQYQGVKDCVDVAKAQDIQHFILMSANGVKAQGTAYQTTKYRAEQYLMQSGMDWTIFRPSVIFGDPQGKMEFATQLLKELVEPPIPAPLFFPCARPWQAGKFQLAPVFVEDVATAFTKALHNPDAIKQSFELCGTADVTWANIIQTLAKATGKKSKLAMPAPVEVVKLVAGVFDKQTWFPITRDQLIMLMESNICHDNAAWETFGIEPKGFELANLEYLQG